MLEIIHLEVKKKQRCKDCSGNGEIPMDKHTYICNNCDGNGYLMVGKTIDLHTLKEMLKDE